MTLYSEPEPYARMATGDTRREQHGGCMVDVTALSETGFHSGRRRFLVHCMVHGLIHPATTGPGWYCGMHRREVERGDEHLMRAVNE